MENTRNNKELTARLTKELGRIWLTCPLLADTIRNGIKVPKNSFGTYNREHHLYIKTLINQLRLYKSIKHPKDEHNKDNQIL